MSTQRPVAAISQGWVSAGGTGAPNYDEFATDSEITTIVRDNPRSALAVEMPHRAPEAVRDGLDFAASLEAAAQRLAAQKADGTYERVEDFVAPYRITDGDEVSYGVFAAVATDQISTRADEPGLVVRNEDVFPAKVVERTQLTRRLGTLLSPVLLIQTAQGDQLKGALIEAMQSDPVVSDVDAAGRRHEIWVTGDERLLAFAGAGELVVADGNHRSLSAQQAGLERFLAVITTPDSVRIAPYDRLIREWDTDLPSVLERLADNGVGVRESASGPVVPPAGVAILYAAGKTYELTLPASGGGVADRLDHAVIERVFFGQVLGMSADDKRISYVGGDYGPSWLAAEVDTGSGVAAVLVSPVSVDDFVSVNLAREKMPRKSTWFVPKARAGLVLADVR
ncbi:DUF1015 family protein [Fodinicola acaciae]|uniref:DUF1015 family protein n=1 Tax=Fodinicola acaciae TaxID=2681555 RepID=UPI0013D6DC32|nr:DUF1015 family protein [Fodinicola acaciae]